MTAIDLSAFDALLDQLEGKYPARLRLARRIAHAGFPERARELAVEALAAAPDDLEVCALARAMLSDGVPGWHFSLVRDVVRNAAYEQALKRVIRPGSRVLEVGTGTGILAMLAARAGADVVTCEMNPAVADAARAVVAANGYADRVRVVACHSDKLVLGEHLTGPADVLVSEILSSGLFGELAVTTIASLHRLLAPGAAIIPAATTARIALAEAPAPPLMGEASGFDLRAFNRLSPPVRMLDVGRPDIHLRSEPADLFRVDFASRARTLPERKSLLLESTGGRVTGVIQWLDIEMDAEGRYENRPAPDALSCWGAMFHPFAQGVDTRPGARFRVTGAHDTSRIFLWGEPDQ